MGKRLNLNLDPAAVASMQGKAAELGYRNISALFRAISAGEVALVPGRQVSLSQDREQLARNLAATEKIREALALLSRMLVAGERRIKACLLLGWEDIPVTVVDLGAIIRGECDENQKRKDWTPTEAVAIAKALGNDLITE